MIVYPKHLAQRLEAKTGLSDITEFVEIAFFASLLREERREIVCQLVLDHEGTLTNEPKEWHRWRVIRFAVPVSLTTKSLAKHAALAERPGEYLFVEKQGGNYVIAGVSREPATSIGGPRALNVRIAGPGSLIFYQGDSEMLSYDQGETREPLPWFIGRPESRSATQHIRDALHQEDELVASFVLKELALELIQRRHGGLIAIMDGDRRDYVNTQAQFLKDPIEYGEIAMDMYQWGAVAGQADAYDEPNPAAEAEFKRATAVYEETRALIGNMSACDGAVLLTPALAVLGFRAQLRGEAPAEVYELGKDGGFHPFDIQLRGTRHRSAAAFVNSGRQRIALVASADGPVAAMFQTEDRRVVYWRIRERYGLWDF